MNCHPCSVSNQIFSTANMAINFGLPSIGMRLLNLQKNYEEKMKKKIENLQKANNNSSNSGNNNFNGGNKNSNNNNNNKNNNNNFKGNNKGGSNNNNSKGDNNKSQEDDEKIKRIKNKIPSRLFTEKGKKGKINIGLFTINLKNRKWLKEKGGYIIDQDKKKHMGKEWKLRDNIKGNRICSIDPTGKILSK